LTPARGRRKQEDPLRIHKGNFKFLVFSIAQRQQAAKSDKI
jgi:hypothetical protein